MRPDHVIRLWLLPAASATFLCTSLSTQATVRKTVPEACFGAFAHGGTPVPFARSRLRLQAWWDGGQVPSGSTVYTEMGFRVDEGAFAPAMSHRLEVWLGNTQTTFGTMSLRFADNLGQATQFVAMRSISLPKIERYWTNPDEPALWLKGDRPFVWRGPHLILEVNVQTKETYEDMWDYNYTDSLGMIPTGPTSSQHRSSRRSCGAVLQASNTGYQYVLTAKGAPPQTLVLLIVGAKLLDRDLGFLVGNGCGWLVRPDLALGLLSNTAGDASLVTTLVVPAAETVVIHAQALHDTAAGLASTNAIHSILGYAGMCTQIYNWYRDGDIADHGVFGTNRAPVVLFKP